MVLDVVLNFAPPLFMGSLPQSVGHIQPHVVFAAMAPHPIMVTSPTLIMNPIGSIVVTPNVVSSSFHYSIPLVNFLAPPIILGPSSFNSVGGYAGSPKLLVNMSLFGSI